MHLLLKKVLSKTSVKSLNVYTDFERGKLNEMNKHLGWDSCPEWILSSGVGASSPETEKGKE